MQETFEQFVRALTAFYLSVGSFAAASLASLLGALFFMADQELLRHLSLGAAFVAGITGVGGLVLPHCVVFAVCYIDLVCGCQEFR